jgi:hypothetical protein
VFDAKRTIARARGNYRLIIWPVEREGDVAAVAFADDEHWIP